MKIPRLLIEDWLPAAAIGVECMRERGSASALAPTTYLHVWWARRPLTVSRAAVLGSLLPADFPRDVFERLLGFGKPGEVLVAIRRKMDTGFRVDGGFGCDRAFKGALSSADLAKAHRASAQLWGKEIRVIDPMAGGGSIPLESTRLGFETLANELNPVACTVLEATTDYPLRHGQKLAERSRRWAKVWEERITKRLSPYFPVHKYLKVHAYIFARTVPCPDTQHPTPLVPDWHLLKPKGTKGHVVAEPVVDKKRGTWGVKVKALGKGDAPAPTYSDGKGISLFTGSQIPSDYIKAKAQAGEMGSALYAVAVKTPKGLEFVPPTAADLNAVTAAGAELQRVRTKWEKEDLLPTEEYPTISSDERPRTYGMPRWADMFSPRQLLGFGVLVEELRKMRPELIKVEGKDAGEAVVHLLAFVLDKFLNYNSHLASWHAPRAVMRSVFDRHDFSFKLTFSEMAPCGSGAGLAWAIDNTLEAYEQLSELPRAEPASPVAISLGSATSLPQLADGSVTAVVVDPPYDDNVQYSELADFFYVWLKRTQGHRRPEWFSTYLCDHTEEAVVNVARFREGTPKKKGGKHDGSAAEAKTKARAFYRDLMQRSFREARRILRDDGVLTVMFTHKKQEAWEALFDSLIQAGFSISATWPVKTESEHSLHQAKKNAAQSTVLLVARKRLKGAGVGYFDSTMRKEIRDKARASAARLKKEGLNPVD